MNAREREKLYADQQGTDALERQKRATAPKCKSCHRPLRWVRTAGGRKMPVDYDPHDGGNVVVYSDDHAEIYGHTPSEIPAGTTLHFSHFATCPNAAEHRRPR